MSLDALDAAQLAHGKGHPRSAVSRAYYAAYSALAGHFEPNYRTQFRYDGNNPGHQQLLALTANNLDRRRFDAQQRRTVKRALLILQSLRANADYNPAETATDGRQSLIALRQATALMLVLGVLQ
jgi:hypothetical protein